MIDSGLRFDESLATVARGLQVGPIAALALVGGALWFTWLEQRGRHRWAQVPRSTVAVSPGPYRQSVVVDATLARAPWRVRLAACASLVVGLLLAPLALLALPRYPFDGIAVPLLPGIALLLVNWTSAWMLLHRSPGAASTARSGAVACMMTNVGLLGIAVAHFVVVEAARLEGLQHACSTSVTFVVILFALASIAQSCVTLAALGAHGKQLRWRPVEPNATSQLREASRSSAELA